MYLPKQQEADRVGLNFGSITALVYEHLAPWLSPTKMAETPPSPVSGARLRAEGSKGPPGPHLGTEFSGRPIYFYPL